MTIKHVCEICGKRNTKTFYNEKFEMILCDSCLVMCKLHKFNYIPPEGEIHYDDEGNIICHICGRGFKKLSQHIRYKHHISNSEYKEKFGLNRTARLTGKNYIAPPVNNDIRDFSKNSRFEKGHKKSSKTRRLQAIKNKTAIKHNTDK